MNDDQRDREEVILLQALELAPGKERAAYLGETCGGDSDLRRSVEQLIEAHAEPASLLADQRARGKRVVRNPVTAAATATG